MIYLIDDNKYGQMSENYDVDFTQELEKYPDSIIWKSSITVEEIKDLLTTASCILIHDSFESNVKLEIMESCKLQKIPYVVFSNGFTATFLENQLPVRVKKDRLYYNLLVFIENFRMTKVVDLNLLHLGIDYNQSKAKIIQNRLFYSALLNDRNFNYESTFVQGGEAYKDLKELIHLSHPDEDIETVFSDFEDDLLNNNVSVKALKTIIKQIVKKVIENG